jgi:1,4-dihydroxy-2-naphthoate octaprenyltransferase
MDVAALLLSLFIGPLFFAGIFLYIAASRAYSYRGIRLKKYPVIGFLTVIIYQGGLVYFLVSQSCNMNQAAVDPLGIVAAALLVGGFYPLTQIYQHREDHKDGVVTLSYILGYKGTFIFTAIIYALAMVVIGYIYISRNDMYLFLILNIFLLPVLVYFGWWYWKVKEDPIHANFKNTMRMNLLASTLTNAAYISLLIIN